ncbi:delta-60 repeat domain-containing protein [Flavobacterium sp.]
MIIAGAFTSYNGVSRNRIARLNVNGTLDTTFNPLL